MKTTMTWRQFCGLMKPGKAYYFADLMKLYRERYPDAENVVRIITALLLACGPHHVAHDKAENTYILTERGVNVHNQNNNQDATTAN